MQKTISRHVIRIAALSVLAFTFVHQAQAQKKRRNKQEVVMVVGKPVVAQDSALVESLFLTGLKEKITSNSQQAIEYFQKILDIDPAHSAANYELAQIYFAQNDIAKAKKFAQTATTLEQDNEWYWLLAARVYEKQNDFSLMNYALDELIRLAPDKVNYQFQKANTLMVLKKSDEALAVYDALEKQLGLTDEIVNGRQRIMLRGGDLDAAESSLLQLLKKDPQNESYYLQLGDLYSNNKQWDKAIANYKKAQGINPANVFVNLALADIYNNSNEREKAFKELEQAFSHQELDIDEKIKVILSYFDRFPDSAAVDHAEKLARQLTITHADDAKSFSVFGDILFQKSDFKGADKAYEQALALNKEIYAVWDQMLRIKLALGDSKGVAQYGEEALTYFPNQPALYFYTGLAYLQEKKADKAVSYLNNILGYEPNKELKTQVYVSLGDAYQELKKYHESAEAYEQALGLDKNNVYALNNYAYYLSLRNEDLDKAAEMSKRSNDLAPDNASYLDTYAWILFRQKKYEEARIWMEKAMRFDDRGSAVLQEHYGDILYFLGKKDEALTYWKKALEAGSQEEVLKRKINEQKYVE